MLPDFDDTTLSPVMYSLQKTYSLIIKKCLRIWRVWWELIPSCTSIPCFCEIPSIIPI